ncbi:response regulator [Myxosarcina sp. GI1]|uniref:response regulator n=1 Tax=Myxosarcina sp. GI1 TaxID=1541065 RepID=UPI00068D181B|nr:response regulator [Myxosarcina sp. GI1]
MIRILIVDDQNIIRQGLQVLLEPKPKLKVVGTASDGNSAIKQVEHLEPDVVLLDIEMPEMNGITATNKICRQFPQTKILVLSSHEDREYVVEALQAGAHGYLLKNTSAEELERAIWSVYQGHSQIESKLLKKVLVGESNSHLIESVEQSESERQPQPEKGSSLKLWKYWVWGAIIVAILSLVAITLIRFLNRLQPQTNSNSTAAPTQTKLPEIKKIAAMARIEPLGEIMSLFAPTSLEAVRVEQLLVQVGDRVKEGQMIAIVDGRQRQQAVDKAETQLAAARSRLAKAEAEAKQNTVRDKEAAIVNLEAELASETQTQQAAIAELVTELDKARTEWQRYQQLFERGAISASELDSKKSTWETSRERLNEARETFGQTERTLNANIAEAQATLEETAQVRPVEVQRAQGELRQAEASVVKAEADMELAYIRAPIDGEIINIHTRPGEALNEKGIAEIGQIDQMMIVAEVERNDLAWIKIGQKATVTSDVFSEELQGKVQQIGSSINKNDILASDYAVVEVEILLAPKYSQKVVQLSTLEEMDVILEL